jgi:hypothetical protein
MDLSWSGKNHRKKEKNVYFFMQKDINEWIILTTSWATGWIQQHIQLMGCWMAVIPTTYYLYKTTEVFLNIMPQNCNETTI